jgi:hypothetical protein
MGTENSWLIESARRLLRGTEWAELLVKVAPSAFQVIPPRALFREFSVLIGNLRRFDSVQSVILPHVERAHAMGLHTLPGDAEGHLALWLYFSQILGDERAVIDLRRATFSRSGEQLRWNPRPLLVAWDPDFLASLRKLYRGFYRDQKADFSEAVAELGLAPVEDLLIKHIGGGEQRRVVFDLAVFRGTFNDLFMECRRKGIVLHSQFVPLGAFLLCLYENLSSRGGEWDVRRLFEMVDS